MRNILDINFRTMINGVSSASTDYNSIELSIVPSETQKTNFKIEVTDYASILHTSNVISLIDGRISYTIPFDYWKGIGTIKVRLLSSEENSIYFTLTNKASLNGSEQVIVKYGESSFEISVVEKSSASSLIDLFLPVGHVITNGLASFDPNVLYAGTTWIRRKGRVIVGVDESQTEFATVDKIGGHKNLQAHSHGITITKEGAHTHGASTSISSGGNHTHTLVMRVNPTSLGDWHATPPLTNNTGVSWATSATNTPVNYGGAHTHGASTAISAGGSHSHGATILNAGTGNAENLQPYITKYVWERIS